MMRISSTGSLAFGRLYPILANTDTAMTRADTSSGMTIASISGDTYIKKICSTSTSLVSADRQAAGRYIHSGSSYFQIVKSTNDDAACGGSDSFDVLAYPDALSALTTGSATITDGVRSGDRYEILDYAHITSRSGSACSTASSGSGAYVLGKAGSQTLIRYAELLQPGTGCDRQEWPDLRECRWLAGESRRNR